MRLYQFTNFPTGQDVTDQISYPTDNEWHHLKVAVSGDNIKCYVDGMQVFNVDDTTSPVLLSGGIGFRTWNNTVANFRNVEVLSLPASATFTYGTGSDNVRLSTDTQEQYIANLNTKGMPEGNYAITVWSGDDELGPSYIVYLAPSVQGTGRGKGKA